MKTLLLTAFFTTSALATCMIDTVINCSKNEEFIKIEHVQCAAPRSPVSHSFQISFNLDGVAKQTSFKYTKPIKNDQYLLITSTDEETGMFFHFFHSKLTQYFVAQISDYNSEVVLATKVPYSLESFHCE